MMMMMMMITILLIKVEKLVIQLHQVRVSSFVRIKPYFFLFYFVKKTRGTPGKPSGWLVDFFRYPVSEKLSFLV